MGYPINTTGDDVFYFPSVNGRRAYFSSYRDGGKGEQDIYILTYEKGDSQGDSPALAIYKGVSKYEDGNVITDLVIRIVDINTGENFGEYRPNQATGKFLFVLEAGKSYEISYETNRNIVTEVIRVDENGVVTLIKEVTEQDGVLVVRDLSKDVISDVAVSDALVSDVAVSDAVVSDEVVSDVEVSDLAVTDEAVSDVAVSDETVSDEAVSDAAVPEVEVVLETVLTQAEVNTTLNTGNTLAINSVMFVYDQVKLIEESQSKLDKIVNYMNEYKDAQLVINGHTDSRGEAAYNYWLSSARSNKIRNYLRKAGIKYSRMETHGYGESKPIADNENSDGSDNPSGRQKNRRVEFIVNK